MEIHVMRPLAVVSECVGIGLLSEEFFSGFHRELVGHIIDQIDVTHVL